MGGGERRVGGLWDTRSLVSSGKTRQHKASRAKRRADPSSCRSYSAPQGTTRQKSLPPQLGEGRKFPRKLLPAVVLFKTIIRTHLNFL